MRIVSIAELRDMIDDENGASDDVKVLICDVKPSDALEELPDDKESAEEDEEEEESEPSVTLEEIQGMTKKELVALIDQEDLDIDASVHKKVAGLRDAVAGQLGLVELEDEDDEDEDEDEEGNEEEADSSDDSEEETDEDEEEEEAVIEKGDTVAFTDDDGEEQEGEVVKVNDKKGTVTVKLEDGEKVICDVDEVELILDEDE